ncbi:DNA recombination protein RmuC [Bathymodiolus septemdierum thioautotrophic gill symbiont]|uniref:DNA recombination protein RmuC n=1 Tax=endosymbiont of Bathymodiolus septemdierum str. Myojin knoll TaxID=1303921 RepID=A0A0N7KBG6_9GAMM|nr:DNA recombination protein RmuC [Bathymodiolus septemdierum thioautotrophic gill symbiont]BAS67959.1 DNA recombination protein RmuC [endosymbiont of Bathymodiolus septemdierum str. Myojin knoll]
MEILLGILLGLAIGASVVFFRFGKFKDKFMQLSTEKAQLITKLEEQAKTFDFMQSSKEQMDRTFEKISAVVLKKDSQNLSEKNADLLNPLKIQIEEFRKKMEGLSVDQAKDRSALEQQIKALADAHKNTLEGTEKLTNALTYDNKQQGDWGEMILESILKDSGLKKNEQYHIQVTLKDEEGKNSRPDVIVHLPDGKDIIIDSKVSLKDYQNYVSGDTDAINAHIKSIDNHIKNISLKSYENLEGVNTLDYIFVFFPIEASLLVALEKKPNLFNDALKKNVALVSPSTLMMSLKTVHHIWNTERQNKNTEEIVRQAGAMYDKVSGFIKSMDDMEKHLNKAKDSYDTARNRLSDGKGSILSVAGKLKTLGVTSKKEIKE